MLEEEAGGDSSLNHIQGVLGERGKDVGMLEKKEDKIKKREGGLLQTGRLCCGGEKRRKRIEGERDRRKKVCGRKIDKKEKRRRRREEGRREIFSQSFTLTNMLSSFSFLLYPHTVPDFLLHHYLFTCHSPHPFLYCSLFPSPLSF